MDYTEYLKHIENEVAENICHKCFSDATNGNGYFCEPCYAEVLAMQKAQNDARKAELAARRQESAKQAAITRKLRAAWERGEDVEVTTYKYGKRTQPRQKNMARYREIKARCASRL